MKLYCPCDEPRPFQHGNVNYVLFANAVTDLPDDAAAHAMRKLGHLGVRPVTGDLERDSATIKAAEQAYSDHLTERAVDLGVLEGSAHPESTSVLDALGRRGLIERRVLPDRRIKATHVHVEDERRHGPRRRSE